MTGEAGQRTGGTPGGGRAGGGVRNAGLTAWQPPWLDWAGLEY